MGFSQSSKDIRRPQWVKEIVCINKMVAIIIILNNIKEVLKVAASCRELFTNSVTHLENMRVQGNLPMRMNKHGTISDQGSSNLC